MAKSLNDIKLLIVSDGNKVLFKWNIKINT